jgi:hypothetical protein
MCLSYLTQYENQIYKQKQETRKQIQKNKWARTATK